MRAFRRLQLALHFALSPHESGGVPTRTVALACAVWLLVTVAGMAVVVNYAQCPGAASTPGRLTCSDAASTASKPWRLVLGVHPKCPCTRATISELHRLLARVHHAVECEVVVLAVQALAAEAAASPVVQDAARTPGVRVRLDFTGKLLKTLGVHTSGAVVLYDCGGTPVFSGGLTPSRGHEGTSLGVESIIALVEGRQPPATSSPAYGCALDVPERNP